LKTIYNNIYSKLPIFIQNIACSTAGIFMYKNRYNKIFKEYLKIINETQWWAYSDLVEYQNKQLIELIKYAYNNVPYYKRIMEERKLKPEDIKSREDLHKLPILTKDLVRRYDKELISKSITRSEMHHVCTSGTTGKSLDLFYDKNTFQKHIAFWWRHRLRFGLTINDEHIMFAGRQVVPLEQTKPPVWRRNYPMHSYYISVHHMMSYNMESIYNFLNSRNVKYYSGYPSGIYLLAKYLIDNKLKLYNPPPIIITGSESLLNHQRLAFKNAFNSKTIDYYGVTEACVGISTCEYDNYHEDTEIGITEYLPIENDLNSQKREIICTGFLNRAMPLIRYKVGDIATISDEKGKKCRCGRESPIIKAIDGRIEGYIITSDGRRLGRLDFLFKKNHNIHEAQLVQNDINNLTINVVREKNYKIENENELLKNIKNYVGNQINIRFNYLEEIPREKNGKFRQIISKIKI